MKNSAKIIAVAGKGGVGKTSVSATIVKLLTEKYPDKKIASVKHKSVMKRFNEHRFAAGANRDYMEAIEFTGLSLDDLIDVALEEMGAISDVLGL